MRDEEITRTSDFRCVKELTEWDWGMREDTCSSVKASS